jgi:hypothetical protein
MTAERAAGDEDEPAGGGEGVDVVGVEDAEAEVDVGARRGDCCGHGLADQAHVAERSAVIRGRER